MAAMLTPSTALEEVQTPPSVSVCVDTHLVEQVHKSSASEKVFDEKLEMGLKSFRSSISTIDLDGDGHISFAEARAASMKIQSMRRSILLLISLIVVLLFGMFATTYWAVELTKEIHSDDGQLMDNDGHVVSTVQHRNAIAGLQYSSERRLEASNSSDNVSDNSSLQADGVLTFDIAAPFFHSSKAAYIQGQAEWVVTLPDGTVRTVQVQGVDAYGAWGYCGGCTNTVEWRCACPPDETDVCPISYNEVPSSSRLTGRRLSSQVPSGALVQDVLPELPESIRSQVLGFLETQKLHTVADLTGVTEQDLSEAFPAAGPEFTLKHRAVVRSLAARAQDPAPTGTETRQLLSHRAGQNTGDDVDRALQGKHCV